MTASCASSLSRQMNAEKAAEEVCTKTGMVGADLAFVFFSPSHQPQAEKISAAIQSRLGPRHLLGCGAQGTIGSDAEVENGPSMALWCATLPEAEIESFHCIAQPGPAGVEFRGLPACDSGDHLLLIADPFTTPLENLTQGLGDKVPLVGGVASAGSAPGENRLLCGRQVHSAGAVGARVRGGAIRPVVSQGCRPIGRTFVVTKAQENLLIALAGKPAAEQLQEVLGELPPEERRLTRLGLHIGRALDEYKDQHGHGDFLIRSVLGVDPKSGALAVTDRFRVGQTVQFHVRDGASAREDLETLTRRAAAGDRAKGALVFSCNGRGTHMHGSADGDISAIQRILGPLPLGGFFAAGEIGPVGGLNFLHGYTASIALFF